MVAGGSWIVFDEPLLAWLAKEPWLLAKLAFVKLKAIGLVIGARMAWGAAKWLPKRILNLILWVSAGAGFRRVVRHYRWRLRAAVRARKGVVIVGVLALSVIVGAILLATSYLSGMALLAVLYLPFGIGALVWRGIRYGFDWCLSHGLGRLEPQRLLPESLRRRWYRQLLVWRRRARNLGRGSDAAG